MPAGGMNTQTQSLSGYGIDKALPGGVQVNNTEIGGETPEDGTFTNLTATNFEIQSISTDNLTLEPGGALRTETAAGNTALLQAYDVNGTAYSTFATLTANNTPSLSIAAPAGGTVAIDGAIIGGVTPAAGAFTTVAASGALTFGTATSTVVLKQGANGKTGTFTLDGATPVAVGNTSVTANSVIVFTLKTVGGTVSPSAPNIQTITPSTGFTVAGTAGDTSVYNYAIIESAA